MVLEQVLPVFLALSLSGNAYLWFRSKNLPKKRGQSIELQEFLGDLMSGEGVVSVRRIDPQAILLRSPRARN